jgi:hypothetical protein
LGALPRNSVTRELALGRVLDDIAALAGAQCQGIDVTPC